MVFSLCALLYRTSYTLLLISALTCKRHKKSPLKYINGLSNGI
ncbi:hypothetical protein MGSAQ_002347 [marine sediment metagenome]|uniref:Uncharacterized protein n=1 Tax=marine sediment metagenome TaxID=412755 RepID=A0A1B6NTV4_9ZZZZ